MLLAGPLTVFLFLFSITAPNNLQPVKVIAIWTDCSVYTPEEVTNFVKAMHKVWPQFQVLDGCVEPEHPLSNRFDYENWQRELGIAQYQTLFITKANSDLFDTGEYGGYTYPQMKIGFLKEGLGLNTFLLSHELLHLALYELSGGDISCWSIAVHEHYYGGKHPQQVSVNVGNGWTKSYGIVEHFTCYGWPLLLTPMAFEGWGWHP